jgi:hypothetical protein
MNSTAEAVYSELTWYGAQLQEKPFSAIEDQVMELALLGRGDGLIDLALAMYASSHEVVGTLYKRALDAWRSGECNETALQHHRAIRLACLGNRVSPGVYAFDGLGEVSDDELSRLIGYGDQDELAALLTNPGRRGLVGTLYLQEGLFQGLTDARMLALVSHSIGNPGLNVDGTDSNGPDHAAWKVQQGILHLVSTAPLTKTWVPVLTSLLLTLEPRTAKAAASAAEGCAVIARWGDVVVPNMFGPEEGSQPGFVTSLPLIDEFRCLVAALYGRILGQGKFEVLGSAESTDLAMRCAYYGNGQMTPAEVTVGFQRDGEAFAFAAMLNDTLLLTDDLREAFEQLVPYSLEDRYRQRLARLAASHPRFDPRPVFEIRAEAAKREASAALPTVRDLMAEFVTMRAEVVSLRKQVLWTLVALGIWLWWWH